MAGRPRKPSNILDISGAFKAHPERKAARANEPEVVGELGDAPDWMTPAQKSIWREIAKEMHKNVCGEQDRQQFASLVLVTERIRKPDAPIAAFAEQRMMLARFGLNPADRSRVQQGKPKKDDNPFAEFGVN